MCKFFPRQILMTSYKWLHSIPRETNDKVTVNKKKSPCYLCRYCGIIILFLPDTIPTLFVIYQLCSKQLLPVVGFHNVYCNRFRCSIHCCRSQWGAAPHLHLQIEGNLFHSASLMHVVYRFFFCNHLFSIPCFINFCRWYKFSFFSLFTTISSLN